MLPKFAPPACHRPHRPAEHRRLQCLSAGRCPPRPTKYCCPHRLIIAVIARPRDIAQLANPVVSAGRLIADAKDKIVGRTARYRVITAATANADNAAIANANNQRYRQQCGGRAIVSCSDIIRPPRETEVLILFIRANLNQWPGVVLCLQKHPRFTGF